MSNLSYVEVLFGVINEQDMEGMLGIVENHKNWGQFAVRIPSHLVVSLVDEIKRLREAAGGYKTVPTDVG